MANGSFGQNSDLVNGIYYIEDDLDLLALNSVENKGTTDSNVNIYIENDINLNKHSFSASVCTGTWYANIYGQNHCITNIKIVNTSTSSANIGLFEVLGKCIIQDLTLGNIDYTKTNYRSGDYIGGIAGKILSANPTTLTNCHVEGKLNGYTCAGLIGVKNISNYTTIDIARCSCNCQLEGYRACGAIGYRLPVVSAATGTYTALTDCTFNVEAKGVQVGGVTACSNGIYMLTRVSVYGSLECTDATDNNAIMCGLAPKIDYSPTLEQYSSYSYATVQMISNGLDTSNIWGTSTDYNVRCPGIYYDSSVVGVIPSDSNTCALAGKYLKDKEYMDNLGYSKYRWNYSLHPNINNGYPYTVAPKKFPKTPLSFMFDGISSDELGLYHIWVDSSEEKNVVVGAMSPKTSTSLGRHYNTLTGIEESPLNFTLHFSTLEPDMTKKMSQIADWLFLPQYAQLRLIDEVSGKFSDIYYNVISQEPTTFSLYGENKGIYEISFVTDAAHGWQDIYVYYQHDDYTPIQIYNPTNIRRYRNGSYPNDYRVFPYFKIFFKGNNDTENFMIMRSTQTDGLWWSLRDLPADDIVEIDNDTMLVNSQSEELVLSSLTLRTDEGAVPSKTICPFYLEKGNNTLWVMAGQNYDVEIKARCPVINI